MVPRPAPGGGPAFFERKPEERTPGRREVLSALDPPLSGWWPERGFLFLQNWPAALYPTPVTARPPAGRAGRGGFADGKGRSCTQPFLVEAEKGGSRLSPQRVSSPAPLGNPVAPSSVTFGDSFPPRGSLRRWYTPATKCFRTQLPLPQNANPNRGTSMGFVIAHRPEHCAPPRQNERVGTSGP